MARNPLNNMLFFFVYQDSVIHIDGIQVRFSWVIVGYFDLGGHVNSKKKNVRQNLEG